MRQWRCTIKEVGNDTPLVSEYLGDDYVDEKFCVNWWGLKNADVEWYRLEEVKENVFVVQEDCDNDETMVIGVFSTKEKADECVARNKKKIRQRFYIDEWEIDNPEK